MIQDVCIIDIFAVICSSAKRFDAWTQSVVIRNAVAGFIYDNDWSLEPYLEFCV